MVLVLTLAMMGANTTILVQAEDSVETADWMAEISDEIPLSSISIPGTHDSCSRFIFPGYFLQCQNEGITTQLENGYRYLDIRVGLDEGQDPKKLKLIHAFGTCRNEKSWFSGTLYLESVLDEVYAFLEEHPTETVIVCVKPESEGDDQTEVWGLLEDVLSNNSKMWYMDNAIPHLGDVRGRCVLASRFEEHQKGMNFYWKDQNNDYAVDIPYAVSMINTGQRLWVQDRYKYNMELKWDAFVDDLENCQADTDTFSINFLSTSGSGAWSHPARYAEILNQKFMEYELSEDTCYGILVFDYSDEAIARKVIATNQ